MSFVHLHVHSGYSLDSVVKIDELVKTARAMKMPAVALTDHGQMFGLMEFYRAALAAGIKPILGVETYVAAKRRRRAADDLGHHLVLLAENLAGYRNLCRLVTLANTEGLVYHPKEERLYEAYPRVDKELLAAHSQGLIALSGCLNGEIPALLLEGRLEAAKRAAENYARLFPGRFYLEVHNHGLLPQAAVMVGLVEIGRELGLPLAAANDVHYLKKEQAELHDIYLCYLQHRPLDDEERFRFIGREYYFKSAREMAAALPHLLEALANTLVIAERCQVELPEARPKAAGPTGKLRIEAQKLQDAARAGLKRRLAAQNGRKLTRAANAGYRNRLEEELAVISETGRPGYFLIVADYVNWAKNNDIPVGPGYGPAAGSLVNYALGITEVDPLAFGLLFELFWNSEGNPDIDVEFCPARRPEVIRRLRETYGGPERVAGIIKWSGYHNWGAVDMAGHALIDDEMGWVTELMLDSIWNGDGGLHEELIKAARDNPEVAKVLAAVPGLENLPVHFRRDTALVISDGLADLPLIRLPVEGLCCYERKPGRAKEKAENLELGGQYGLAEVKELGLPTFNFRPLETLTLIGRCRKILRGKGLDLPNLNYDDAPTWALLARGETGGVFQLENAGLSEYLLQREYLEKLRPDRFQEARAGFREYLIKFQPGRLEDLMALLALYRPGPLRKGQAELFLEIRRGLKPAVYAPPLLEPLLKETLGLIIYQEQIMLISQVLAGYSESDLLRPAPGNPGDTKTRFLAGAKAKGINEKKAGEIFKLLARSAPDCVNKAHSAAQAILTYQTAYLKANHPKEFESARRRAEKERRSHV